MGSNRFCFKETKQCTRKMSLLWQLKHVAYKYFLLPSICNPASVLFVYSDQAEMQSSLCADLALYPVIPQNTHQFFLVCILSEGHFFTEVFFPTDLHKLSLIKLAAAVSINSRLFQSYGGQPNKHQRAFCFSFLRTTLTQGISVTKKVSRIRRST